jgi:dihydroflavonol-4-reductase
MSSDDLNRLVLVTGATGFLARHLLPILPGAFALVRTRAAWDDLPHHREMGDSVPIVGNLDAPADWALSPTKIGTIVHLAALVCHSRREAEEVYRANVDGTLSMVRLAAESRARLVLVSTSGTVGCFSSADERADEGASYCADAIRRWPYYDSKMRAEIEARRLADQLSVELVIVRLPVLLGPADHRGRSTSLVRRIVTGRQSFSMAGGIAFSDVRDVARGIATLVSMQTPRRIYHLAGTSCSLAEFFRRCAALAGTLPPRLRLPKAVPLPLAHLADRLTRIVGRKSPLPDPVVVEMASRYWGFASRWSHELGYAARPAEETLRDTIAWLQPKEGASP